MSDEQDRAQELADTTAVAFFLLGASKENQMFNGHKAADVLKSFCRLSGVDHAALVLADMGVFADEH